MKFGGLQTATVAQPHARNLAVRAEFQHLDDRTSRDQCRRALSIIRARRAIEIAQPDA